MRSTFDERGNRTGEFYFGADGKPCLDQNAYAEVKATYDERGNRTSVSFFGADGKPRLNFNGIAEWKATYDERGNETSRSFFGTDGKPCLNKDGIAGWKAPFDERGNRTSESYFGTDGKPCLNKDGFTEMKGTFDERGNEKSRCYFDERGQPLRPVAVQVQEVMPKGKAAALGLHAGDIIVRYDGQHYTEFAKLISAIKAPGEKPRELVVRRDGKEISYQVTPGLLGVMLRTLYGPDAPESSASEKPGAKPAAPSSTDVPPEKKDALPAK